jgi:hypothetical protein
MVLSTTLSSLDECGHVYVAGAGANGECLRLNSAGSRVWRAAVGRLTAGDMTSLPPAEQAFLESLVNRGVLTWTQS